MGRLIKLIVIAAILFFAWKYALPWIQHQTHSSSPKSEATQSSCTGSAARASEAWGSGLHAFVNPPYDLAAWSTFRGDVESKIAAAESEKGGGKLRLESDSFIEIGKRFLEVAE